MTNLRFCISKLSLLGNLWEINGDDSFMNSPD
jgi:hypothetical protein